MVAERHSISSERCFQSELPILERENEQPEEKIRIGRASADLIADKETVCLGSGTTVFEVARNLRTRRNLTVITNSLPVLNMLAGLDQIAVISTCSDLTVGNDESFVNDIRDLFPVVRSGHTVQPMHGAVPFVAPAWFVDFRRADEVIPAIETMREQNGSWLILGMHGVGAGTHNNFIDADEHRRLIDWIASQCTWLEAATVLEAVARRGRT